jgi:hypothetical protein
MVFSRNAAMELQRRALALSASVPSASFLSWNASGGNLRLSPQQLQETCRLAEFEFIVTSADLGVAPLGIVPTLHLPHSGGLRLYHCPLRDASPQARAAAAAT